MERQRATKATKAQKAASAKSRKAKMKNSGMKQMLQNVLRPYLRTSIHQCHHTLSGRRFGVAKIR